MMAFDLLLGFLHRLFAELAAGGQYSLSDNAKFAKVANLRVKMG
jgi:hypothetical protein